MCVRVRGCYKEIVLSEKMHFSQGGFPLIFLHFIPWPQLPAPENTDCYSTFDNHVAWFSWNSGNQGCWLEMFKFRRQMVLATFCVGVDLEVVKISSLSLYIGKQVSMIFSGSLRYFLCSAATVLFLWNKRTEDILTCISKNW